MPEVVLESEVISIGINKEKVIINKDDRLLHSWFLSHRDNGKEESIMKWIKGKDIK